MKKNLLLLGLLHSCSFGVFSQSTFIQRCATDNLIGYEKQISNTYHTMAVSSNDPLSMSPVFAPKRLRVHFWAVRSDDGTEGSWVTHEQAIEYIRELNQSFEQLNICFELVGNGVLMSSDNRFNQSYSTLRSAGISHGAYDPDAINVYFCESLYIEGGSGVTSLGGNTIALNNEHMWYSDVLLSHEVGHTLYLIHTHGGYNSVSGSDDGSQCSVGAFSNCEHVTRDVNDPNYNADIAGDKVEDTAADPFLYPVESSPCYNVTSDCVYFGNEVDCQGTPYEPDESVLHNIMSYGPNSCSNLLTPGQGIRVHNYLEEQGTPSQFSSRNALITEPLINFDLYIRDGDGDFGEEPNTINVDNFWSSPDIWVRNTNDGQLTHQNPIYSTTSDNYVSVRVVNRGCSDSDGQGVLKLYWTKAGTNLPIGVWEGDYTYNGYPLGGLVGELPLGDFSSYEEKIFTFPWTVPNPNNYSSIGEPWHYCLLAKVVSDGDVSSQPEIVNESYYFLNSNNIALKNVHIIYPEETNTAQIHFANFDSSVKDFTFKFQDTKDLFNDAEVKITLPKDLFNLWNRSTNKGKNFKIVGRNTILLNKDTELRFDSFPSDKLYPVRFEVNFLMSKYQNNIGDFYDFNVLHFNTATNQLIGGEHFMVYKNARSVFKAEATPTNNSYIATDINEPALYRWYDSSGTLLETNQDIQMNNLLNDKIVLEVTSQIDGYKDYQEFVMSTQEYITNLYPNPAQNHFTITYDVVDLENPNLIIVNTTTQEHVILSIPTNSSQLTIDTTNYTDGLYYVILLDGNSPLNYRLISINH